LEHPPRPSDELADIAKRLRTAMEIQAILREESSAPVAAALSRLGAGRAAPPASATRPAAKPARPQAAAPVRETSVPPPGAPAPAAAVVLPWQQDPARFHTLGELHDAFEECRR